MTHQSTYPIRTQNSYEHSNPRATLDTGRLQGLPQDGPVRSHQFVFPEAQLGPRTAAQASFETQEFSRGTLYRDIETGRAQGRAHYADPQRTETLQQSRQARSIGTDAGTRYTQQEFDPISQPGAWDGFSTQAQIDPFDSHITSDHLVLDQLSNANSTQAVPEKLVSVPSYTASPRSSPGKDPRPLSARNGSDDNLSTATTAVEASNPEILKLLTRITSTLSKIQKDQAVLLHKMQAMDTATTTRLSDFRDHVDKKFDRAERNTDGAFDELWERTILEGKRTRDFIIGDGRRTPPQDDEVDFGISSKRKRFE